MKYSFLFPILLFALFSSCEKTQITLDEPAAATTAEKAFDDGCRYDDFRQIIHHFNYCGVQYTYHASLDLFNIQETGFHRIQAYARCYKAGGDPTNFIDFAKMEVAIGGEASIWCTEDINIEQPSDYNAALVNGQVPSWSTCNDCGDEIVTLNYVKNITLAPGDKIYAKFGIFLDEDGCGAPFGREFIIEL